MSETKKINVVDLFTNQQLELSNKDGKRRTRRKKMISLMLEKNYYRYNDLIDDLKKNDISSSLSTIKRDFDSLGIKKNVDDRYYELDEKDKELILHYLQKNDINTLKTDYDVCILNENISLTMTTKPQTESIIAAKLSNLFDGIIGYTVGTNIVTLYFDTTYNKDSFIHTFHQSIS